MILDTKPHGTKAPSDLQDPNSTLTDFSAMDAGVAADILSKNEKKYDNI